MKENTKHTWYKKGDEAKCVKVGQQTNYLNKRERKIQLNL